nr:chalcone 4'-O-glucosyltransferase [Antirrhinum majus]AFC90118.1 chalcone 4'-O-glucosyltransferase [Antirrhinum majus]
MGEEYKKTHTIVFHTSEEHLNSSIALAKFITKHHSSISITIISTAPAESSEVAKIINNPSITYRGLTAVALPENLTSNINKNPVELFFEIPRLQNANLGEALLDISRKSDIKALIIDFFCNAAFEVSTSMNIPTYFDVSGGAFLLCTFLHHPTLHQTVRGDIADLNDSVEMPGFPLIHSSDLPMSLFYRKSNVYKHFLDTSLNMRKSSGILVNTFVALEFRAKEALSNGLYGPTPPVYLLSHTIAEPHDTKVLVNQHDCLSWLDLQPSKSVIFLCFGRRGAFSAQQLKEIAIGLEKSGCRFLWLARISPEMDLNALLPEGFLSRTKGVGFVTNTWVPQKEVLSHDAAGGFVTHCGWNSVLEALSFGVPMIGWPLYAEQRINRVFMVEEIKVALPLDEEDGFVTAMELEKRVRELMESVKGKEVKRRVAELKISTKAAVSKGGSSLVALEKFINSVTR